MRLAAFVTMALVVAGCRAERTDPRRSAAAPTAGVTTVTSTASDSLALTLLVPNQVRAGEPVPFRLRVENRSPRPLDLYLRGRVITFDVVIADASGGVVWQRLANEMIPAIVQLRTLAPGERMELEAAWDQRTAAGTPAEPGGYAAHGLLLVEGDPLGTPPVPFRIVPR